MRSKLIAAGAALSLALATPARAGENHWNGNRGGWNGGHGGYHYGYRSGWGWGWWPLAVGLGVAGAVLATPYYGVYGYGGYPYYGYGYAPPPLRPPCAGPYGGYQC
jgi:hypothetical protein